MMINSESIARHFAGILVGLIVAGLSGALMSQLWPEMWLASFLIVLTWWALGGIKVVIREDRNPDLAQLPGRAHMRFHKKRSPESGDEYEMSYPDYIMGQISTVLFGTFVALIIAGVTGKLWPVARWPVFFVLFALWAAIGIIATTSERGDT